ncbi:MAG: hypothetical protein AMDU4_FER2C00165G0022 [Ferroplasma sp. Type II]|jgi:polyferredoxin|uniref:4Fe-4S binding protein n=1 Tax=Ferroplasma sp. Type II TaxID=261388 RepID=UPI00038951F0|nr:4Fe-4S binding protein [Ferroplasma sp. Type II]EQB71954.1 MAG: hypothetical protein AMDU4_FER2C00165G0022 [Ferroplasma sp. Type II]
MFNLVFLIGIITIIVMVTYIVFVFSYIIKHKYDISFLKIAAIGIFTAMMASMLDAFLLYITTVHNFIDTALAFSFGMILMSQPIVATFVGVIHGGLGRKGLTRANATAFTGLIIWNEVSMGLFLFYLFNPTIIHFDYYHAFYSFDFVSALSNGINTIYFLVPMSVEMFFLYLVYKPKGIHKYTAISIFTMDLFAPTILGNDEFVFIGGVGETAVMIIFMIIFFEFIAKHKLILPKDDAYHIKMIFIDYLLMGTGTFIGTVILKPFGFAWIFFAIAIIFGMWYYFQSMFSIKKPSVNVEQTQNNVVIKRKQIVNKPAQLIFFVLLASFISELFMAGSMDFATYNYLPFYRIIDTLPVYHGASVAGFYAHDVLKEFVSPFIPASTGINNFLIFYDMVGGVYKFTPISTFIEILYIIGYITDSPTFLMIMGIEMIALVIARMRVLKDRGKKINLTFAIAAYILYTTIGPNFLNPLYYNKLPLWANTGAQAALYPYLIIPLLGSYALYAFLALLFGRRSYCSTLCPSAVMYGGTLGQSMVKYNYESKLSRKMRSNHFTDAILFVASGAWIWAILASLFSYMYTTTGRLSFSIYGIDPSVFYSYFIWNILWYVFFFSIPFVGMSPCRKYGWCSTGTLVGFFSVLGFFKLKVKDKNVCKTCETKDCATSCEVGMSTMPGEFIKKGSFKSVKCVGAGDCLRACPYDNIYFYDVRNYLKEKLGHNNKDINNDKEFAMVRKNTELKK